MYHCIFKLSPYLLWHKFTVQTDHWNLLYLEKASSPKLIRWRLRLQEYNFEVQHVPGKDNVVADGLSWCLLLTRNRVEDIGKAHNAIIGHHGINHTLSQLHALNLA